MSTETNALLRDLGLTPVLMDIGASGSAWPIWDQIAPQSTYVGFDPDLREIHEDRLPGYRRSVIVNEAVVADGASEVDFYLTRSPYCSTTLPPNPPATNHWLERDAFVVESRATVRATTIDDVLRRLNIERIDWLKLDSQGIDLRLFNSISPDVRSRILAVDTEPGFQDIYQGEDLFVDVHRDLTKNGFWLSHTTGGGFIRMRKSTLDAMHRLDPEIDEAYIRRNVRTSPTFLEARYLRTLEWLEAHSLPQQAYELLWVFALIDEQIGFALDVSVEFERHHGETDSSRKLKVATLQLLKQAARRNAIYDMYAPAAQRAKALVKRLIR